MLGDWPWFADRDITDEDSIWHNFKGQPNFNILWGDSHVEHFEFPPEYQQWSSSPAPDPDFTWW